MENWRFEINFGTGFVQVPPPKNWMGLVISILFIDDQPNASLQGLNLQWVGDNAVRLNQIRQQSISGTRSIYNGVPLRITVCGETPIFDGYIDIAADNTQWECDSVTAPVVEKGRADWLNDVARGESFATLARLPVGTLGRINPATDYKKIPYTVNDADSEAIALASLTVSNVVLLREFYDLIRAIPELVAELTATVTTAVATGSLTVAMVALAITKVILHVSYLALMIIAIVSMVKAMLTNLWQSKKYKLGMREQTCWQRICQRFGLGFSSTIYAANSPYKDATHIPSKSIMPSTLNPLTIFRRPQDESVNFPNNPDVYGHPDDLTCADYIERMCQKYNGGISIINNVLHFEEVHYWNTTSTFIIPNTDQVGNTFNLPQPNGTNASECAANYLVKFATDVSDKLTTNRYKGTSCEIQVRPANVPNVQVLSQQSGIQILLPEALAKRKEYLSKVENLLNSVINTLFNFCNTVTSLINGLLNVLNGVISVFGGNSTAIPNIPALPTNILNNRLGWMELSSDSFNVPKTFIGIPSGSDWLISLQSEANMSAYGLMQNFHGKNLATRGNQQLIYSDRQFKFCCEDYQVLKNRNVATSPNNRPAKFRGQLQWDIHNNVLRNVEWGEFTNWDNSLTEKIIIDAKGN